MREGQNIAVRGTLRRRAVVVGGAAGAALAGCGPASGSGGDGSQDASGKPVVIVDSFGSSGIDPVIDVGNLIKWGMGDPLARVSRKGDIEPWLATSWKSLDPLQWELKLRDSVKFWDGSLMDASAVKGSLEMTIAKNAVSRDSFGVSAIEVVDAKTLRIRTLTPNAGFPSVMASRDFAVFNPKAAESMGAEAFARQPVLTGPFRPIEFKKDEVTTAVRFDDYWAGKPGVPRWQIKLVPDANTRLLALQSGDADMAMNLTNEAILSLRAEKKYRLLDTLGGAQEFVLLNPRSAPFDDVAVRRAFSLGIDRKPLVDKVLAPTVEVAGDIYSPIYPWALKNQYPTDAVRAAKLLDDAGWRMGSDGVRQKGGRPLSVTAIWYAARTDLLPIGITIQAQLKALGFKIELKQVENVTAAIKANDWNAAVFYNNTAPQGDPQTFPNQFLRTGGTSTFGYSNPELDRLLEQMRSTFEPPERLKIVLKLQDLMTQEVVVVPLVVKKEVFAVNDSLKKLQTPHPTSTYVLDYTFNR